MKPYYSVDSIPGLHSRKVKEINRFYLHEHLLSWLEGMSVNMFLLIYIKCNHNILLKRKKKKERKKRIWSWIEAGIILLTGNASENNPGLVKMKSEVLLFPLWKHNSYTVKIQVSYFAMFEVYELVFSLSFQYLCISFRYITRTS